VDVLILLPDAAGRAAQDQAAAIVSRLWDVGIELGHSVRTIEQCLSEAQRDITVQTTLLEARWLAGDKALLRRFEAAVHKVLDARAFFEAKLLEQQQRHNRFHDTAYNLEPNLKEGPGGLRPHQYPGSQRAHRPH
jgi:[protein-PII] uridylyltransferase